MVLISYVPGMQMEEPEGKASSAWTSNPWWWASCQAASRTGTDSQKPLFPQWTHTGRVPAKPWPFLIAHLTTSIYTFNPECEEQSHAWAFLSAEFVSEMIVRNSWMLVAYCTVIPEDWIQCCGSWQSNAPNLASGVTDWLHQSAWCSSPRLHRDWRQEDRWNWWGSFTFKMWEKKNRPFIQNLM